MRERSRPCVGEILAVNVLGGMIYVEIIEIFVHNPFALSKVLKKDEGVFHLKEKDILHVDVRKYKNSEYINGVLHRII